MTSYLDIGLSENHFLDIRGLLCQLDTNAKIRSELSIPILEKTQNQVQKSDREKFRMSESGTSHLFGGDAADSDPFGGITTPLAKLTIDSSIQDYWDTSERSRFKFIR